LFGVISALLVFVYRRVTFGAGLGAGRPYLRSERLPTSKFEHPLIAAMTIVLAQAELADLHLVGHAGSAEPGTR
jgi:hypothetical protein